MKYIVWAAVGLLLAAAVLWWRAPVLTGPLTKQTLYVALIDALSKHDADVARCLWIDDDGGEGVFTVKRLCDELHVKATFAVCPARLSDLVADSLAVWQQEGFGIALHGLNHESWRDWSETMIKNDLQESRRVLARRGIDTLRLRTFIVPPHASNTSAVRRVVKEAGCKMVTGAHVVNPDSSMQQWGRVWVTSDTDMERLRSVLERAYRQRGFVIIGTHSSATGEFSAEKMRTVIRITRQLGYEW